MCPPSGNDNDDHTDNDGRSVLDISGAWLAKTDAERQRTLIEEVQRLNADVDEFIPADFWKTANETRRRAALKTKDMLEFVASNPTHQAVQRRLDDIFETIQFATGIKEVIHPVLLIIEVLISPLEQLGAWARLEPWFMQMFPALVDHAPKDIPRWQRMMIQHCKYTGLRTRLDSTIDDLLEVKQHYPHEHSLMLLLRSTTPDAEHKLIAGELLDIAEFTQDYNLMMQVHAYKAHRHLENYQFESAFAHAQQAFLLAAKLQDGRHLALTAWYMASVFHQHNGQPAKALFYLDLARDHAEAVHDRQWLVQMQAIRGFSYHALKQNQEAVTELQAVLPHLDPNGLLYARVLYVWCAALSFLNPTREQFAVIETSLRTAMRIFKQQRSFPDILSAHMAIVQIYLDQNKLYRARHHYHKILKPIINHKRKAMSEVHKYYVDALKRQLNNLGLTA